MQALEETGLKGVQRLDLVTRGSQSAGGITANSLASTPLWGLARVLMNEQPALQTRLIDLDSEPDSNEVDLLLAELQREDGEDEVAFRSGIRYVHRLESISSVEFAASETQANAEVADAAMV